MALSVPKKIANMVDNKEQMTQMTLTAWLPGDGNMGRVEIFIFKFLLHFVSSGVGSAVKV